MQPQHKPKHAKGKKFGAAIGLDKFSTIKKSKYDKRVKQEKERALNAAKVNAYKKLKKRLGDKLEPKIKLDEEELDEEPQAQQQRPQQAAQQDQAAEPETEQQQQQQHAPPRHHAGQQHYGSKQWRGDGHAGPGQQDGRQKHGGGGAGAGGGKRHKPLSHMQRIAADVQAEKEAAQREREERQRAAEERRAKLAADAKQRAAKSKQFRKKTSHGQPVMKYRLEKMLQQLQPQ